MGKSTAGQLLAQMQVEVADTDLIAREVVEPGQPALEELQAAFGNEIMLPGGTLNRQALARIAFADTEARHRLESILHPRIRAIWLSRVETWGTQHRDAGVVIIPLLFETKAEVYFDATICVACSALTQAERLRARKWSLQQINERRQAQWPLEKKMLLSDYVVWSEGSLEVSREQLTRIISGFRRDVSERRSKL